MTDKLSSGNKSDILIYRTEGGETKIEVRLEDETVWLTQKSMAALFQTTKQNISLHLQNVFAEGELCEDSVVKDFLTTAADGKKYVTKFYNLDAIISIGYRIKSHMAFLKTTTKSQRPQRRSIKTLCSWCLGGEKLLSSSKNRCEALPGILE